MLGKNGQVGAEILKLISPLYDIIAPERKELDLNNIIKLKKIIRHYKPDVIINSSGYTQVDQAEIKRELALTLNAKVPCALAQEIEKINSFLIHFSSDYVFDGTKNGPYKENDKPNPLNFYGISKLAGENKIKNNCKKFIILRTSWVIGSHGKNFVKKILNKASKNSKLQIVNDQFGAPTWSRSLAYLIILLLEKYERNSKNFPFGIYHASAMGKTTWYNVGKYIIEIANLKGKKFNVLSKNILAISSSSYVSAAKRPFNSILDSNKLLKSFGFKFPFWKKGINETIAEILNDKK